MKNNEWKRIRCYICQDPVGFLSPTHPFSLNPKMCKRCVKAFNAWRAKHTITTASIMEWTAKRACRIEHKRMADKVKELELKLRIEIATTNGLIRKYGNTTTEIGDMNSAK